MKRTKQKVTKALAAILSALTVFTATVPLGFTAKADNAGGAATLTHNNASIETGSVTRMLADAQDGDTVTLNGDATENVSYSATGKTVVLDGGSHKITGVANPNGNGGDALTVLSGCTLILKDITLKGGAGVNGGRGIYADVTFTGTVAAWENVPQKAVPTAI